MPRPSASARASPRTPIVPTSVVFATSFAAAPEPSGPTWSGEPSADRSGVQRSTSSAGPPTKIFSGAAFSAFRFHTTSSWPASRRRRATRLPIAPSPTTATTLTRPRLLRLARTIRPAGVPAALPRADDVVRRQRVRERRARLRRPRAHGLEGRPRLRPRRPLGAAGALPARGRDLVRPAAAPPRDGGLQPRERPEPGRGRRAPPLRPRADLAARGARRGERRELGVLLPRLDGDRPADGPAAAAPERERAAPARPERELHRRRGPGRRRRRRDEPRRRHRRRLGQL